jgi:4-carboxymuconolactone decarboxylase
MKNIIKGIFLSILIISSMPMKAQKKTNANALNAHQKSMAAIASLTAVGDLKLLKTELNGGLDAGLTINEIKEALVQLYAYCGFPRSLNGISTLMAVVEERKSKGLKTVEGKAGSVIKAHRDRYEQGRLTLEALTKTAQKKPAPGFGEFAPRADAFLKEHLFADIFDNEVLNHRQREFITISALSAMEGVTSQLQAHVSMGRNTGVTDAQLAELSNIIEKNISRQQANTLRSIIGIPGVPIMDTDMIVRISEIEILPEHLEAYKGILKEESSASVNLEPGVISIFPMSVKDKPNQIRIVEIYKNQAAYKSHIASAQFQEYKTSTLKMVKDLKLVDMNLLDPETMQEIFKKLK